MYLPASIITTSPHRYRSSSHLHTNEPFHAGTTQSWVSLCPKGRIWKKKQKDKSPIFWSQRQPWNPSPKTLFLKKNQLFQGNWAKNTRHDCINTTQNYIPSWYSHCDALAPKAESKASRKGKLSKQTPKRREWNRTKPLQPFVWNNAKLIDKCNGSGCRCKCK